MRDQTAQILAGVDAPKALPGAMAWRLEHALYANSIEPTPENLSAILDRPRRLPGDMRARLTAVVTGDQLVAQAPEIPPVLRGEAPGRSLARVYQGLGAAAAAVLVLTAAIVFGGGSGVRDNKPGALPPTVSQPSASVPVQPKPSVLPTKIITPEVPSTPPRTGSGGGKAVTGGDETPAPQAPDRGPISEPGSGGIAFAPAAVPGSSSGSGSSNASAPPQPGTGAGTGNDLVAGVGSLLQQILRNLGLSAPAGTDRAATARPAATAPAPAVSAPARPAGRAKPAAAKPAASRRTAKPAAPRTTAAPAAPAKPAPLISVELPEIGVSLSL